MQCPVCSVDTQQMTKANTLFDRCPKCGGAWFDAPELERLLGNAKRPNYAQTRLRDYDSDEPLGRDHHPQRHARGEDSDSGGEHDGDSRHGRRRRRGFLESVMGIFD